MEDVLMDQEEAPFSPLDHATMLHKVAHEARENGNHTVAVSLAKRATALIPDNASGWFNLSGMLHSAGKYEEALVAVRTGLSIKPEDGDGQANHGLILNSMNRLDEAEQVLKRLIAKEPERLHSQLDLGLLYLSNGRWEEGWPLYDLRFDYRGFGLSYQKLPLTPWRGEDLSGKTIYVQAEQGIGDIILFSRYLYWLKNKYNTCRILFCCHSLLVPLLWGFHDVVEFLPLGVPWPDNIDYGTFLLTLPRYHETSLTNICHDPKLILRNIRKHQSVSPFALPPPTVPNSLKVGICWTGNPRQRANIERTVPLTGMLGMLADPRITFYSLQCGPGEEEFTKTGADLAVVNLAPLISGALVHTALAMLELDLVITCCTSIAHLAGALGVPCWIMLPFNAYWVWLREVSYSPWYPSVKLFRQPAMGDWNSVLADVQNALLTL